MVELAAVGHRVARVDRQVHDHLLDLAGVGADPAQARAPSARTSSMSSPISRAASPPCRATTSLRSSDARLQHLLAAEGQQLAGQRRPRARRPCGSRSTSGGAGSSGGERREHELAVAGDHGEQVVEVVGHAAGQPPDGLHLLRLAELLLGVSALGHLPAQRQVQPFEVDIGRRQMIGLRRQSLLSATAPPDVDDERADHARLQEYEGQHAPDHGAVALVERCRAVDHDRCLWQTGRGTVPAHGLRVVDDGPCSP